VDAERAVLASMLLDARAIERARALVRPSDFHLLAHAKIFDSILAVHDRGERADLITVNDELRKRGDLEAVGGAAAVSGILEFASTAANIEAHVRIVREAARARELKRAAYETIDRIDRGESAEQASTPVASRLNRRDPSARALILVREQHNAVIAEAEAALLRDSEAGLYQRARRLVRIIRDPGAARGGLVRALGLPVVEPLTLDALCARIDHAARCVRQSPGTDREHDVRPPRWVARGVVALERWQFPVLEAVLEAPTLKPDGEVVDRPGYDAATGLLLMPTREFPRIPSDPSSTEVRAAVELLREPFCDFPFVARSDQAAAMAATLSLVARHAIEGPVPLFAWRAPGPGTGKGLGCDVAVCIGTGRTAARTALPSEDEELRKMILAIAFEATPAVLLDNVDRALGSHSLAAALTADEWAGRLLGATATIRAPLRAVWLATGNGLGFRGDLARRVVPIDLDAGLEHPEDRSAFRHPDLLDWVGTHRGALLAAALTILRAYHVAGRPAHSCGPRMGSFEAWDDLVRGACVWAGFGDPLASRERLRNEDDSDLLALRAALTGWCEAFGEGPKTAAEGIAVANDRAESGDSTLRDALLGLTPNRDKLAAAALGHALRRVRGRIAGGLRFETSRRDRANVTLWKVVGAQEMPDMPEMFPAMAQSLSETRTDVGRAGIISGISGISGRVHRAEAAEARSVGGVAWTPPSHPGTAPEPFGTAPSARPSVRRDEEAL
jgi:hypothetical protein